MQLDVLTLSTPEQLKALGHPLRMQTFELLNESDTPLTNRELASRLGVDPGHLHFHVKMLLHAGLIEHAEGGRGRAKPYRAVAAHVRVAPELISSSAANDARAALLRQVERGWEKHAGEGAFRAAQVRARITEEDVRELYRRFLEEAIRRERPDREQLVITLFSHPRTEARES
jgi:DNA-binding transcriptional ArsR family regulator